MNVLMIITIFGVSTVSIVPLDVCVKAIEISKNEVVKCLPADLVDV